MTKRTFVFCANVMSYNNWLRKNNLSPLDYRYLGNYEMLYGLLDMDIIVLGGVKHNSDHHRINEVIRSLDFLGRISKMDYYEDW